MHKVYVFVCKGASDEVDWTCVVPSCVFHFRRTWLWSASLGRLVCCRYQSSLFKHRASCSAHRSARRSPLAWWLQFGFSLQNATTTQLCDNICTPDVFCTTSASDQLHIKPVYCSQCFYSCLISWKQESHPEMRLYIYRQTPQSRPCFYSSPARTKTNTNTKERLTCSRQRRRKTAEIWNHLHHVATWL